MTTASKTWRCWRLLGWLPSALSGLVPSTPHCHTIHCLLAVAVFLCLAWSIASALAVFPHELSYFNEFAGGPLNGATHLLDGNIDWGQDLLELKRWREEQSGKRGVSIAYVGVLNPRRLGIDITVLPQLLQNIGPQVTTRRAPPDPDRWFAISINQLYGYKQFAEDADDYALVRNNFPLARVGYSLAIVDAALVLRQYAPLN